MRHHSASEPEGLPLLGVLLDLGDVLVVQLLDLLLLGVLPQLPGLVEARGVLLDLLLGALLLLEGPVVGRRQVAEVERAPLLVLS